MTEAIWERTTVLRRGRRLEYVTVAWNLLEGLVAVVAGVIPGSMARGTKIVNLWLVQGAAS